MRGFRKKHRIATLVLFIAAAGGLWIGFSSSPGFLDGGEPSDEMVDNGVEGFHQRVNELEKARNLESLSSLEEKISVEEDRRKRYLEGKTLLSAESLIDALDEKGVEVGGGLKERLLSGDISSSDVELLQLHIATVLTEEESFYVELSQYTNFDEMHAAFKRREEATGLFYGTKMLAEPSAYRGASVGQIKAILDRGAILPDNVLSHLIRADNIALAEGLAELGYDINTDFQDEFSSMNGIEILARNYTYNPLDTDPREKANDIRRLADLGVALNVKDGTRDVLDIVLEASIKSNYAPSAHRLVTLAHSLIDMGVELDASHFQLLEKLEREKPNLYQEVGVQ